MAKAKPTPDKIPPRPNEGGSWILKDGKWVRNLPAQEPAAAPKPAPKPSTRKPDTQGSE